MGAAIATNVADNISQTTTNIIQQGYLNCQVTSAQVQEIAVVGCSNVTIDDNYFKQYVAYTTDCIQQNKASADVQNQITLQTQQLAASLTQQFGLGTTASTNVAQAISCITNNIQETFTTSCATTLPQAQDIKCVNSDNVQINGNTF